ncbi:MAG: calmodulin-like protein, partial [Linnemannia elongata]
LTPEQIADFKESFDAFDRNNDGTISRRELHSLLHTVGHKVKHEGFESMLSQYDTDQSGNIDFDEFLSLAETLMKNKEQLASFRESFDTFDKNGDGSINASELKSLLRIVGEKFHAKHISETMQEFDTNKDNHIDFEEFLVLANKLVKNKAPITP